MQWLQRRVDGGTALTEAEALEVLTAPQEALPDILAAATAVRRQVFGDSARLCSILNAKSGKCGEDCKFCAQSSRHATDVETYSLLSDEKILAAREEACRVAIQHFGVVTSGGALSDAEVSRLCELIRANPATTARWCASLGALSEEQLRRLKQAGLRRYHHNLETVESHFSKVCTTHTYADRVRTVLAAKRVGLEVCSGGIFGMGEGLRDRVEFAMALRSLDVDSIPLNFLVPVPGTPLAAEGIEPLAPTDIIKTIAMFRLVCRRQEIRVCAGRERYLGDLEPQIFAAGATGMMIGGYLTVRGRSVEEDLALVARAGMRV